MQRAVVIFLICVGLVEAASAKSLRTTGTEFFCVNALDLKDFAAAASSKGAVNEGVVPGCRKLRKGLRYSVLSDEPDRPARIRLELGGRRGRTVEGYIMSLGE